MRYELEFEDQDQCERFKLACRDEMEKQGLTQRQLANELNINIFTMHNFFRYGARSRFIAARLADELKIDDRDWL